jgi:hypothetical protein
VPAPASSARPADCPSSCPDDCDVSTGVCNPPLKLLTRSQTFVEWSSDGTPGSAAEIIVPTVQAKLTLAMDLASIPRGSASRVAFIVAFAADVGARLGVAPRRIVSHLCACIGSPCLR